MDRCGVFAVGILSTAQAPRAFTEPLRFALADTREAKNSTMVGDRKPDITGALANGMTAIGVTYGYGSPQELLDAGAEKLVSCPEELSQIRGQSGSLPPLGTADPFCNPPFPGVRPRLTTD